MDHAPNVKAIDVRDMRVDALNRAYLPICEDFDWLFLQTEVDFNIYKDISSTVTGTTIAVTNNSYFCTLSAAFETSLAVLRASFTGHPITFTAALGSVQTTYTIRSWISTTEFFLTTAYAGTTGTISTWSIAIRRTYLPVDCARALGFIDREDGLGRMVILDRRREELFMSTQSTTAGTVYWMVDDDNEFDRAPDTGLILTDDTTGGTVEADSVLEYCYTFTAEGRESPPSVPMRITTSAAASHQITLASFEQNTDPDLGVALGYELSFYRRQISKGGVYNFGRWLLWNFRAANVIVPATTTDDGSPAPSLLASSALVFQNGRKWMRSKWVPGTAVILTATDSEHYTRRLRYLRRPRRLVADSDVPELPGETYHDLLVYGAAIDLGQQHGVSQDRIERWQRQYDALLKRMRLNHLAVPDAPSRREPMNMGGGGRMPYRAGVVSSDYSG